MSGKRIIFLIVSFSLVTFIYCMLTNNGQTQAAETEYPNLFSDNTFRQAEGPCMAPGHLLGEDRADWPVRRNVLCLEGYRLVHYSQGIADTQPTRWEHFSLQIDEPTFYVPFALKGGDGERQRPKCLEGEKLIAFELPKESESRSMPPSSDRGRRWLCASDDGRLMQRFQDSTAGLISTDFVPAP
jgi:hypothetical protein